ncbi:MAG: tandem-95 repeat protein, partial [Fuerstiella sp.]|nr:tandem-95 repeat protein [Fuerstiella sp.]
MNVTVNPVNDAPVTAQGASVSVSMDEDGSPTVWTAPTVTASDSDPDTLTWSVSSVASNGTASVSGTGASPVTFTYTPNADWNGSDNFEVQVSDGNGGSDSVIVNVTVNPVNDAPVIAQGGSVSVSMDEDASPAAWTAPAVTASDIDPDTLTWGVSTAASNGTANVSGTGTSPPTFTYTPNADWNGTDSFVVQVSDGIGSDTITVSVTVSPVNDAPIIDQGTSVGASMDEDGSPTAWTAPTVTASDIDQNTLTWSVSSAASNGTANASGTGASPPNFTYTPNADWNGTDNFIVQVSDGNGGTDTITVSVTVNPVNDSPVITGQNSVSVPEETTLSIGHHHITVNDIDNSYPSGFGLTAQDGANYTRSGLVITPNANFNGTLSVPVKVNDGLADSNVYNLSVTVTPTDDGPLVSAALPDVTVSEDAGNTPVSLASLFTDIDNDNSGIVKSVLSNSNPGLVSATVIGDTLTLAYQADQNGTAYITVRGTSNGQTADDTFLVTVNPADDGPAVANAIADVTVSEDSATTVIDLGSVFTDIDSNTAAIVKSVQGNTNTGLVSAGINGNTLTLTYQADQNGTASVTVRGTSDGKTADDTFTVTVNATDDALTVAAPTADMTVDEDAGNTGVNLGAVFTDIDNDDSAIVKSVLSNSNPSLVSAAVSGNILILDYQENQNGTAEITVRGTSNGKTADDTFTVTVNAVDDAPSVAGTLPDLTVDEDSEDTTADLSAVFTDIDNDDTAIAKSVQSNTNESLVSATVTGSTLTLDYLVNQSGTAVITILAASGGQTVTDEFTVTVSDANNYISGTVTYYSNGDPVSGTVLTLENPDDPDDSYTATSGQTGAYLISSVPSGHDYVLTPLKSSDPGPETLSSSDASRIARAVVRLVELTDLEMLAADVTGNGRVTIIDASRVARYKTGIITQMNDKGRHWAFSPVSEEYSPLDSDIENLHFTAMRLGDISGTWKAEPFQRSVQRNQAAGISEISVTADRGAELSVPVVLETETAVEGIDITAVFDEKVLDAAAVTLANGILENKDYGLAANTNPEGRVASAIFARSHLVTDAGTVAVLRFRVVGEQDDSTLLTFSEFECNRIP